MGRLCGHLLLTKSGRVGGTVVRRRTHDQKVAMY